MLSSFCEDENDLFFDSAEISSSDESNVANIELGCSGFGYDIWLNEPLSVKDRREKFLRGMGFDESPSQDICNNETKTAVEELQEKIELNRLAMCSGAVSSSCDSTSYADLMDENSVCSGSALENDANCMVEVLDSLEEGNFCRESGGSWHSDVNLSHIERWNHAEDCRTVENDKKKIAKWWKSFASRRRNKGNPFVSEVCGKAPKSPEFDKLKVKCNKKRWMELSALCTGQEIQAHNGKIWTMKFSPDGQYLASGGEDGVVRVWLVKSADAFFEEVTSGSSVSTRTKDHTGSRGTKSSHVPIVMPNKVFRIDESPLHEFNGHTSDVLDLAWSNSNDLLSCSEDKTARLWKLGYKQSVKCFNHNDYVTCVQFNPVDENYFVSGSIDGKARIWGVYEERVVDWADIHDLITAICYRPNGKGFAVGCITGRCHFFDTSGYYLQLETVIDTHGRKKTSNNRVTSIQFSQENTRRVMISSGDSKVRVFEDVDVVYKFGGATKSRCQMSASFAPTGKHVVSVGEDSHVYIWNYDGCHPSLSKDIKSDKSCEHFYSEGATVALSWSAMGQGFDKNLQFSDSPNCIVATPTPRESECFSLGNCFSADGQCRGSATWPEETLPTVSVPVLRNDCPHGQQHRDNTSNYIALSETWGLVILTASVDGTIRTFHNYGLPVRL